MYQPDALNRKYRYREKLSMHGLNVYEGSGGIAPPILNLETGGILQASVAGDNRTRKPTGMKVAGRILFDTQTGLLQLIIHRVMLV
jgi:hypothetical protein